MLSRKMIIRAFLEVLFTLWASVAALQLVSAASWLLNVGGLVILLGILLYWLPSKATQEKMNETIKETINELR